MEQQNKKRNMNNILYGIIGIATLMITTIGATFAYYTATASNNATIKGNMATVSLNVKVTKVTNADDQKGGLIPMSNNMMEQALQSSAGTCIDNNGNAVCQVYKIIVENTGTSSMLVDGYVTLTGGSGEPADYTAVTSNKTTMRWAQAFCTGETSNLVNKQACSTAGNSTVRSSNTIALTSPKGNATTLGGSATQAYGTNTDEIISTRTAATYAATHTNAATINGNKYEVIYRNYIRVSDHVDPSPTYGTNNATYSKTESGTKKDITSALVYNQFLDANDYSSANNTGTSTGTTYTDAQVFYIVVWLSENGHNQTANEPSGANSTAGASTKKAGFFTGNVTFVTAQGNEVTATFVDHYRVSPDTLTY